MGVAAYYRGSASISASIKADFDERRRPLETRNTLQRAEDLIAKYDEFSQVGQALLVDIRYCGSVSGFLKTHMNKNYNKKKAQKKFVALEIALCEAHCAWVDSDIRFSVNHLAISRRKAKCVLDLINFLNSDYHLPFRIPPHISA